MCDNPPKASGLTPGTGDAGADNFGAVILGWDEPDLEDACGEVKHYALTYTVDQPNS